ncbi:MAG: hypothetical protein ACHP78_17075 [Terriglobales bacterium]
MGVEVHKIPWEKVLTAIKLRDVAGLRLLAEETPCEQRRQLLQVFAGIVENGMAIGESQGAGLPRIAAQLVRNSVQQPIPAAGARARRRASRTALYRADGYSIELRLEHEPGSQRLDLSGRIADSKHPRSKLKETTVLLMSGKNLVALAVSDALGRFQMQCAPARSLRLHASLEPRGQGIEVPLGVLTSRFLWPGGKPESDSPATRAC